MRLHFADVFLRGADGVAGWLLRDGSDGNGEVSKRRQSQTEHAHFQISDIAGQTYATGVA